MSVRVTGLDDTLRRLSNLEKKAARSAIRKAVNAGGTVFTREVRRQAKRYKRKGYLAKAIRKKVRSYKRGNAIVSITGAVVKKLPSGDNPGNYFHLMDGGTRPHMVGPRKHPGASPRWVIRKASSASETKARTVAHQKLDDEVTKALQS